MKQDILSRYDTDTENRMVIDVSVGRVGELYEDYDSAASYVRKDLDQDFVDYLIESAQELRKTDFLIRINLPTQVEEGHRQRVRQSMVNYFRYLEGLARNRLRRMIWKSFFLFCLGAYLLVLSMVLAKNLGPAGGMVEKLVTEGLTVAAWVSMWNAFANVIFGFADIIGEIRTYRRIAGSEVLFAKQEMTGDSPKEEAKTATLAATVKKSGPG
jgi:hypothetical protein